MTKTDRGIIERVLLWAVTITATGWPIWLGISWSNMILSWKKSAVKLFCRNIVTIQKYYSLIA